MDDLLEVQAILINGDTVALQTGTMYSVFRVVHDPIGGETSFVFEGMAHLTGAYHTVRMHTYGHSASPNAEGK